MSLLEQLKRRNVFLALVIVGRYEQALASDLGRNPLEGYDCARGGMP